MFIVENLRTTAIKAIAASIPNELSHNTDNLYQSAPSGLLCRVAALNLHPFQQLVILIVCANPVPINMIGLQQTQSSITDADTDRVNRLLLADSFELKAGVIRIFLPERIGFSGLLLN
jgi:3-oxoacyl-ACP reductase-like protein